MGVGIIGSLAVCVGALIASATLVLPARPRPVTFLVFFGSLILVFVVDESAQLRLLLVVSSIASVFLVQTLVRRLPKSQIVAAVLAIVLVIGYYLLLLFGLAPAGV